MSPNKKKTKKQIKKEADKPLPPPPLVEHMAKTGMAFGRRPILGDSSSSEEDIAVDDQAPAGMEDDSDEEELNI